MKMYFETFSKLNFMLKSNRVSFAFGDTTVECCSTTVFTQRKVYWGLVWWVGYDINYNVHHFQNLVENFDLLTKTVSMQKFIQGMS